MQNEQRDDIRSGHSRWISGEALRNYEKNFRSTLDCFDTNRPAPDSQYLSNGSNRPLRCGNSGAVRAAHERMRRSQIFESSTNDNFNGAASSPNSARMLRCPSTEALNYRVRNEGSLHLFPTSHKQPAIAKSIANEKKLHPRCKSTEALDNFDKHVRGSGVSDLLGVQSPKANGDAKETKRGVHNAVRSIGGKILGSSTMRAILNHTPLKPQETNESAPKQPSVFSSPKTVTGDGNQVKLALYDYAGARPPPANARLSPEALPFARRCADGTVKSLLKSDDCNDSILPTVKGARIKPVRVTKIREPKGFSFAKSSASSRNSTFIKSDRPLINKSFNF